MTVGDIAWFSAEAAAYAVTVWWALTRPLTMARRIGLAVAVLLVMAVLWGTFASPTAEVPLTGAVGIAFKAGWFAAGAAAGVCAVLARRAAAR